MASFVQKLPTLLVHNWKPALAVSLINIPLSISLAVASLGSSSTNAPLIGILTAIWGGMAAAFFASSKHNIYGPAGALSAILLAFVVAKDGGILYIPVLAIITGFMILLVYAFRLTRYITLIPSTVLHGFLLGVGITIAISQLNSALGITPSASHSELYQNLLQTFSQISQTNLITFGIFLVSFVFLLSFKKWVPKIPGAIPLTFLAILVGYFAQDWLAAHSVLTLQSKFPSLAFYLSAFPDLSHFHLGLFQNVELIKNIFQYAVVITIVSVLETFIAAKIAEKATKVKFDRDREVFGLGISNVVSGLFGGMPTTAVLVRTALNMKSGANSRVSAFLVALFTLAISWLCFDYFKMLPMPVIAAILMSIAVGMIELKLYRQIWTLDTTAFVITMIVGFLVVAEDSVVGIIAGTIIALLIFIKKVSEGSARILVFRDGEFFQKFKLAQYLPVQKAGDIILYRFNGSLTYLNIERQVEHALHLHKEAAIIMSFGQVHNIDIDGIEALEDFLKQMKEHNTTVYLTSIGEYTRTILSKMPVFHDYEKSGKVYDSSSFVLKKLGIPEHK